MWDTHCIYCKRAPLSRVAKSSRTYKCLGRGGAEMVEKTTRDGRRSDGILQASELLRMAAACWLSERFRVQESGTLGLGSCMCLKSRGAPYFRVE